MNQLVWIVFSVFTLMSCGSAEEVKSEEVSKKQDIAQATAQTATAAAPTLTSGTTDKNRGEKISNVSISGTLPRQYPGKYMYLYTLKGKNHYVIDSTKIGKNDFAFDKQKLSSGFYMLGLINDRNMMAIIVNDEPEIKVKFTQNKLEMAPEALVSEENKAWFDYYAEERLINSKIKSLRDSRKNSSFKERINNQIKEQENTIVDLQQRYIRLYNDLYLAKYLDWKTADSKADIGTYWDDVDFTDPSVMKNVAIPDRVQDFMRSFADGSDGSFYNCVDVLKAEADQGNDDVLQFVLFTMADGFYQSNKENVTAYIIDNHILGEDCSMEPGEMLANFIDNVNDLSIGGTPPNFSLTSEEGKMVNLNNYAKQGEYTLLIFWASWCHKCEQEMPVLNQVYDRFSDQGFQVVAFSLDMNETSWKKGITDKAVPGQNVTQLKGWQSSIVKDYRVTQTPTSFLLDSEGNIVLKPKRIFEVDNFLRQNIK